MRNSRASLGHNRYVRPTPYLEYRARILKTDLKGHETTYYDGGPLTPYTIEATIELVLAEASVDCSSLDLTLELEGECSEDFIDDIAARFGGVEAPGTRVRICAFGHSTRLAVSNPVIMPASGH